MSSLPLSHHEILRLIEPFTRCGRHVDLAASNRLERCLVFKPVEHRLDAHAPLNLRETLQLQRLETGTYRLKRTLSLPDGLQATLTALGSNPAQMLPRFHT